MYSIKIVMKSPMNEKQKNILFQSAAEAECLAEGVLCEISGKSDRLEQLSYLLGIAVGICSENEVLKLSLLFEKSDRT